MMKVLPAPEWASRVAEQHFDAAAFLPVEKKSCALFPCRGRHYRTLCRSLGNAPFALQMPEKLRQGHRIQHTVRRYAAFARHLDAPVHMVELPDRVRVGIDAEDAAIIQSFLVPAPVKVEAPGMRVDLDGDAVLGAGFQDPFDIDLISRPSGELTPGHVAKDRRIGILNRFDNALSLLSLRHFEAAVNAGDDKIEFA
jgi:hypothetical protein